MARLVGRNVISAFREGFFLRFSRSEVIGLRSVEISIGAFHLNALTQQDFDHVLHITALFRWQEVSLYLRFAGCRVPGVIAVSQQLFTVFRCFENGGHGRGIVVENALAVGLHRAFFGHHGPTSADTALLSKHTDGTQHAGVAGAVARIKKVESFAGEIVDAVFIKCAHIGHAEGVRPGFVAVGQQQISRRGAGRGKIIAVVALLMVVHVYLRHPFLVFRRQAAHFGVNAPDPVAVEVEPIVVGAAIWPGFVVFQVCRF